MFSKNNAPFPSQLSTQEDPCVYWDHQQGDDRLSDLRRLQPPVPSSSASPSPLESESHPKTTITSLPKHSSDPQVSPKNLARRRTNSVQLKRRSTHVHHEERDDVPSTGSNQSTTPTTELTKSKNNSMTKRREIMEELISRLGKKSRPYGQASRKSNSKSHRSRSTCSSIKTKFVFEK